MRVLAPVPKIALHPAFVLVLGFDHSSKVALVVAHGLGYMLVRAARNFQTVDMFEPIITITLLGLFLNGAFNALRARLVVGFAEQP